MHALINSHVIPFTRRGSIWSVYRFKPIIKNQMILWSNETSVKISHQSNIFSMKRRKSNILSALGSGLPLRNFTTSLSPTGFQNINRAAPRMGISKTLMIALRASKNLNRGDTSLESGCVIVEKHCMSNRKGPYRLVILLRPV